jgi:hypothetical protein
MAGGLASTAASPPSSRSAASPSSSHSSRCAAATVPHRPLPDPPGDLGSGPVQRPRLRHTLTATLRLYGPDDYAPSRAVLAPKRRLRIDVGVSRVEEVDGEDSGRGAMAIPGAATALPPARAPSRRG